MQLERYFKNEPKQPFFNRLGQLLKTNKIAKIATVAGIDLTKISDGDAGEHTARITM